MGAARVVGLVPHRERALARTLAQAPAASPRALREAERAIGETLEHHAHLRLRPAVAR